jgi:hypothetical protein
MKQLPILLLCCFACFISINGYDILLAVNCGGDSHTDSNGIDYEPSDPLECNPSSSLNPWLPNVPKADVILYRTFCYRGRDATFELPIKGNGKYLLLIKLNPHGREFTVSLNYKHKIFTKNDIDNIEDDDNGYDHYTYFSVCENKLYYKDETSKIGSSSKVDMNTGLYTAISAFALMKGDVENFPILPTAKNYQAEDLNRIFQHECAADVVHAAPLLASETTAITEVKSFSSTTETVSTNGSGVTNIFNYYNMTMIFLVVGKNDKNVKNETIET